MALLKHLLYNMTEVVEAEGRALQRNVVRVLIASVLLAVSLAFMLMAFGLVTWGLYMVLEPVTSPSGAAFIVGAIDLVAAFAILVMAKLMAS